MSREMFEAECADDRNNSSRKRCRKGARVKCLTEAPSQRDRCQSLVHIHSFISAVCICARMSSTLTPNSWICSASASLVSRCTFKPSAISSNSTIQKTSNHHGSSYFLPLSIISLATVSLTCTASPDGNTSHMSLSSLGHSRCNKASKHNLLFLSNSPIYTTQLMDVGSEVQQNRQRAL